MTEVFARRWGRGAQLLPQAGWQKVLAACGVKGSTAQVWAPVFAETTLANSFSMGLGEVDDFLGQVLWESGLLEKTVEDLNYTTAARICAVWPSRFPTLESAQPFVKNPEGLANKVYGKRMGNTLAGDGWRYRGRCPIGVTGLDNYEMLSDLLGQDFVGLPELLEQPRFGLEATIAWWEKRVPDAIMGDIEKLTLKVNGGKHGLAERQALTLKARRALG